MKRKLTVVFEYPDGVQLPSIGRETTDYEGAKVVAFSGGDAFEKLDAALEELACLEGA